MRLKFCFPPYFGMTRRNMNNKIFFMIFLILLFFEFVSVFSSFYGQHSAMATWATTPHLLPPHTTPTPHSHSLQDQASVLDLLFTWHCYGFVRAPPVDPYILIKQNILFRQILVQVCLRAPPVVADKAKLAIVFTYFFLSSFFFFYAFCISPTSGKLPWLKICFSQYFGITRRNI